jgi:hypothetical protein
MACLGVEIVRTRVLPAWTGVVFLIAMVILIGQYAAFLGALPFPQFLALPAIGVALLAHRRRPTVGESGAPAAKAVAALTRRSRR